MRITLDNSILAQVLEDLEEEVISHYYNNLLYRHLGITQTIELIKRYYKFLSMRNKVSKFIKNCVSY
jgi:hypothetical protein